MASAIGRQSSAAPCIFDPAQILLWWIREVGGPGVALVLCCVEIRVLPLAKRALD